MMKGAIVAVIGLLLTASPAAAADKTHQQLMAEIRMLQEQQQQLQQMMGGLADTLKTVTANLRPGYLRKNGVPYSERAVFTEFWDVHTLPNGGKLLVNTNVVEDPVYLQLPFQTAIHYKLERDTSKWEPTPCDARF